MTNTEKICNTMGNPAPNMNHETGIHYGVIPQNALDSWSLDDIYSNGIDLGYESAQQELKDHCLSVANILKRHEVQTEEDVLDVVDYWFSDYDCSNYEADTDFIKLHTTKELANDLFDHFEDQWQDAMSCAESGPYRYESDGYIMETDSHSDLFITESSYYTLCRECSPCAPNAGYLLDRGDSMKAYCLGHEWFEGDKAPYPVFRVDNDEEVLPNETKE